MERFVLVALAALLLGCESPSAPETQQHEARVYVEPHLLGASYVVTIDGDTTRTGTSLVPFEVIIVWQDVRTQAGRVEIAGVTAIRGIDGDSEKGR